MSTVVTLALKDIKLLLRDKAALFWVMLFPLLMALFFGSIFGGFSSGGSRGISVYVVDEDQTDASAAFVKSLEDSDALRVTQTTADTARSQVRLGKKTAYILLRKGFSDQQNPFAAARSDSAAIEVGIDPARQAEAGMLKGLITQASFKPMMDMFSDPSKSLSALRENISSITGDTSLPEKERQEYSTMFSPLEKFFVNLDSMAQDQTQRADSAGVDSAAATSEGSDFQFGPKVEVVDVAIERTGPRSSWEITFPQALIWALIGCASTFSVSIVVERTRGTFTRLRLAPIGRAHILAGKGLACFITCIVVMAILMTIAGVIFGVTFSDPVGLALAIGASAFCFVGLMMTIAVIGKTEQAVGGGGMAILLVFAMLGGGMVPLAFMPSFMQTLSSISPVKWAVLATEGVIWRGFSMGELLTPLSILVAIGLIGFTVGTMVLARADD